MPKSNTVARTMHDVGLAAWFGGSLMGAVGLNAASGMAGEPKERARVANAGWARWTGPNAVAIGAHLMGATILFKANSKRVVAQRGVATSSMTKLALTGIALGATAYARAEGQKVIRAGDPPVLDGTTPSEDTPPDVAAAQRRLALLQWVVPAATGALIVLAAAQSEQQRPAQVAAGVLKRVLPDGVVAFPGTVHDARGRAYKKARKAARKAQKRAHATRKDATGRARELSARAQDVAEQAQDLMDRAHHLSEDLLDRAHSVTGRLPATIDRVAAFAEHLPTQAVERVAG